jgi:hypothetical protein
MQLQNITDEDIRQYDHYGCFVTEHLPVTFNPSVKIVMIKTKHGKQYKQTVLGELVDYKGEVRILLPKKVTVNISYSDDRISSFTHKRYYKNVQVKSMACYMGYRKVELAHPLIVGYGYTVMCSINYK